MPRIIDINPETVSPAWTPPSAGLGQTAQQPDNQAVAAIYDEIQFWSRQLAEHALFMNLGFTDAALKRDAGLFHNQWEQFRKTRVATPPTNIDQTKVLATEYKNLAANLRNFKLHAYERAVAGDFIGWLYPLFLDHIRRELDYSVATINRLESGQHRAQAQAQMEELCENLRFMLEHAVFVSQLLDPTEARLIQQARQLGMQIGQLHAACSSNDPSMIALSEQAVQGLDQYLQTSGIGTPKVRSVIHPVLAQHVVREGQKALQTMQALRAGQRP